MNTTHTRGAVVAGAAAAARRSQKIVIVVALALGAILLALSATVAHAAPGDVGDDTNPPNIPPSLTTQVPLQLHASENPVHFELGETVKQITLTWNSVPEAKVDVYLWGLDDTTLTKATFDKGSHGPWPVEVKAGVTYRAGVYSWDTDEWGPYLIIQTTKRSLPDVNPTLIPTPGLPGPPPVLPGLGQRRAN